MFILYYKYLNVDSKDLREDMSGGTLCSFGTTNVDSKDLRDDISGGTLCSFGTTNI